MNRGIFPTGHQLPAETWPGPVRLQVADLQRSLDYYETVLGLRAVTRESGRAVLSPLGEDRALVILEERPGARTVSPQSRLGLFHFAILLPTRADLGRFLRQVAAANHRAGASDHHVSEALYLRDPDGLGIEVYADRPRSEWQANGPELRMETRPMDVASVMEVAGEAEWRGMPAGTVMGHVHLHVGDLDRAEAFYHQALGLDKTVWSYPGALFLSAGGYHHHLGLNVWAAGAPAPDDDEARLLEWTLEVPDADRIVAAAESLDGAGHPVERAGGGDIVTRDPWGTRLRLRVRKT